MLYRFLSKICILCVIILGLLPFMAVELAPDHFFAYLFGSFLTYSGCYVLNKCAEFLETKAIQRKNIVTYVHRSHHNDQTQAA